MCMLSSQGDLIAMERERESERAREREREREYIYICLCMHAKRHIHTQRGFCKPTCNWGSFGQPPRRPSNMCIIYIYIYIHSCGAPCRMRCKAQRACSLLGLCGNRISHSIQWFFIIFPIEIYRHQWGVNHHFCWERRILYTILLGHIPM